MAESTGETNAIVRVLDAFLPPAVAAVPDADRTRGRSLVIASVVIVLVCIQDIALSAMLGSFLLYPYTPLAAVVFAAVPLVYRLTGRYRLAAWLALSMSMLMIVISLPQTGGLLSVHAYWLPLLPAIALILLDYQAAVAASVFLFAFAFVLVRGHAQGILPEPPWDPARMHGDIARVVLLSSLFFLAVSYARERALEDAQIRRSDQQRARARAEAASRAKSSILASVSHELRTPMTGILGLAELLADTPLQGPQDEWVRTIRKTGNALLALLDDLLDSARLDSGQLTLKARAFRPVELAEQVVSLFRPSTTSKGLELIFEAGPEVPEKMRGDPSRIRQVLINLVGNAVKFTDKGRVVVRVSRDPTGLIYEVRDTGPGIPEDRLGDVFAPFVRAQPDGPSGAGGVGLGLSIAQLLADAMRGEISVDSREGHGTRFVVRLPLDDVSVDEPTTDAGWEETLEDEPLRVLIAEDNAVNRMVLTAMLESLGHTVEVVEDGAGVPAAVERFDPEVVLMDIRMPVVDGLEATRRLRAQPETAGLRVVALTANAFDEDREACMAAGMDEFLTKPVSRDGLRAVLSDRY